MEQDQSKREAGRDEKPAVRRPFRQPEIVDRGELNQITGYFGLFVVTGIPGG